MLLDACVVGDLTMDHISSGSGHETKLVSPPANVQTKQLLMIN